MDEPAGEIVLPGAAELRTRLETSGVDPHTAEKTTEELVEQLRGERKHAVDVVETVVQCLQRYRRSTGLPAAVEPHLMSVNVPRLLSAIAGTDEEAQLLRERWATVQRRR